MNDHVVITSKFMVDLVCQAVALAHPSSWKVNIKTTISAASTESLKINSGASVDEA